MLILTRRIGEMIKIGEDVSVTILEVKGNQVRIGIAAPTSVAVHREEVFRRIEDENRTGLPSRQVVRPTNCVRLRKSG